MMARSKPIGTDGDMAMMHDASGIHFLGTPDASRTSRGLWYRPLEACSLEACTGLYKDVEAFGTCFGGI